MKKSVYIWMFFLAGSPFLKADSYTIPFRLVQNLIVIEATVDNNTGLFILDTGSDAIFVDKTKSLAQADEQEFNTLQGSVSAQSFIIKHFSLGNLSKRNLEAYNARMDNLEAFLSLDIAGIVGANVFSPHSILLDFISNQIHVVDKSFQREAYSFTQELDFSMDLGVPTISVSLENKLYHFILDSGASSHMIDQSLINIHPNLFRTTSKPVQVESLGSREQNNVSRYILDEMQIGQKLLSSVPCVVNDFSALNHDGDVVISGLLSLSNLNVDFVLMDFRKHKILF